MVDITEENRSHWNEAASTYNNKFSKTIEQIITEIQSRRDWIGADWVEDNDSSDNESGAKPSESQGKKTVRLLDYACGTGLVSRALAPYVTQCVGVDISEGMVNEYNTSARNQGIPENEMFATLGNLLDASSPLPESLCGPEFFNFDITAVGLGFHHFDDPALATRRLAERLKKGGVLMIVDFLPHGNGHGHGGHHGHKQGHGHGHGHGNGHGHCHEKVEGDRKEGQLAGGDWKAKVKPTIAHMGFSEEEVKSMFEGAGVGGGFEYVSLGKGVVFGEEVGRVERSVFMARGSKL